jgi:hypothetical protein
MHDDPQLSPAHRAELAQATQRARKIQKAARVAGFNGWTIGFFAGITILLALRSPPALVLGIGMAFIARNEFRGRDRLRRFEPEGAVLLGRNQLGFMVAIVLYCLWSIAKARTGTSPDAEEVSELLAMLGESEDLVQTLTLIVYTAVIGATVVFQGLNAWYYFARRGMIEAYLRETPQWIVELRRGESA